MNNITIWCTYHDPQQLIDYNLCNTDLLKLYYVNDISLKEYNINHLNKYLSELCTYYYVWANQIKSNYVGFCHYRRHFQTINYEYIDDNHIQCYEDGYALSLKEAINNSIGDTHWFPFNTTYIVNELFKYINHKYNVNLYSIQDNVIMRMSYRMSYIFTWETFNDVCDFIFGFFDFMNNELNINWKSEDGIKEIIKKIILSDDPMYLRGLSSLCEYFIAIYIGLAYEIKSFRNYNKIIVYSINDKMRYFKMHKLNLKTGVLNITNLSNIEFDANEKYALNNLNNINNITLDEFVQNDQYKFCDLIILKDNEYIDCADSFKFFNGKYKIKSLE